MQHPPLNPGENAAAAPPSKNPSSERTRGKPAPNSTDRERCALRCQKRMGGLSSPPRFETPVGRDTEDTLPCSTEGSPASPRALGETSLHSTCNRTDVPIMLWAR
ncbi:unnamed protein product [Lampetra fluviatilis]